VAVPGASRREHVIALEASGSWVRGRGHDAITLSPLGAVIEHGRMLRRPLQLPLGTLQVGLIDSGPARVRDGTGRFPVLRRLSATAVIPREEGIEGWLWTSPGGSGLTVLGDEDDAPNGALLFTTPLGEEAVDAFQPRAAEAIAAGSPLGAPAVYGLLFRVSDTLAAERTFRQYGLLRPLTDREVPPPLRRSLPTDRSADQMVIGRGDGSRAASSIAPPGMG
jgi:hypothetical protein